MFTVDSYLEEFSSVSSTSLDIGKSCGAITYELWYNGDTSTSTVNSMYFEIVQEFGQSFLMVNSNTPEGIYKLKVKA